MSFSCDVLGALIFACTSSVQLDQFQMSVVEPKPKILLKLITTGTKNKKQN